MSKTEDFIDTTYDIITKFFTDEYKYPDIIKNYMYKKNIKSKKDVNEFCVMREKIFDIIKKKSTIKVKGNKEFKKKNNNKFYIIKVNSDNNIKLLILYSIFYYLDSIHANKNNYVGLDFEFNKRIIALCQVSFYPLRKHKFIFIYDPKMLNPEQNNILIRSLYISHLNRILHGCDSLDIPYLYDVLFKNDKLKIMLFTKYLFDTRFICEYYKIFIQDLEKKCSIYDALLFFNVIRKKKYEILNRNNDNMGPVQDINWNVMKMSSFHLKYAAYDVLYLHKFFNKMMYTTQKNGENLYEQMLFIPHITRFVFYEKYLVTNLVETSKKMIDPVNNYILVYKNKKITLISLYETIIKEIHIGAMLLKISNLLSINYFKSSLNVIFKRIIYSIAYNNYEIYENKNNLASNNINMDNVYETLEKYEMNKIMLLFDIFHNESKDYISTILSSL
jgi:hypothetical protein